MSLLRETCTIRVYSKSVSTAGQVSNGTLDTETSNVPCAFQQDTSTEVIQEQRQRGVVSGKLYYPASYTITSDDRVYVRDQEWYVIGDPVKSPGSSKRWVTLERKFP